MDEIMSHVNNYKGNKDEKNIFPIITNNNEPMTKGRKHMSIKCFKTKEKN